MRYFFLLVCLVSCFQVSLSYAAVPVSKKSNSIYSNHSEQDSVYQQQNDLPEKPKKRGIGLILGGSALLILGFVFGVTLLLFFLFGFAIGQTFYFQDIYLTAGIMLAGLGIFGLGVFMISRGLERWRLYRKYRKALKKFNKSHK